MENEAQRQMNDWITLNEHSSLNILFECKGKKEISMIMANLKKNVKTINLWIAETFPFLFPLTYPTSWIEIYFSPQFN